MIYNVESPGAAVPRLSSISHLVQTRGGWHRLKRPLGG